MNKISPMKFPLSWFKSFLPTKLSPSEIASKLTMLGFEVDAIHPFGMNFSNVVVAEILSVAPHPQAEKLSVAEVSDGSQSYQVVCGAANCRKGIRVAFAKVGGHVGEIKIEARKLRGVDSFGMLAGHDELNLPVEPYGVVGGIMELSNSFELGKELAHYFGELVFEVSLTPNLAYAAHVRGLAHELGAFLKEEVRVPSFQVETKGKLSLSVKSDCPRYGCRLIENVKMAPSPDWLVKRLEASGLNSINHIVDATHYVMLECGQPMHAFDFDKIEGGLEVRFAKEGEKITTLDGKERFLTETIQVIADDKKILAIAGVMGSADSAVTPLTENILLEAAYFDPILVRKAARQLEMSTDASYRFERGSDPNCLEEALDQATSIILEVGGGKASPLVLKGEPFPDKKISCRIKRVNELLGTQLAISEVETILSRIGFKVSTKEDLYHVTVPFMRHDLNREIDLIEEVARFYGYDHIVSDKPTLYRGHATGNHPAFLFERAVRDFLLQEGLQELLTCDLIGPKEAAILEQSNLIYLRNPHSHEQSILRPSLLPSLLKVVQHNADHGLHDLAGFEIGKLHLRVKEDYLEPSVASIVLHGERTPHHWSGGRASFDFFDIKGVIENLLNHLHIDYKFTKSRHPSFHPGRQASIEINGKGVGILGQVHPSFADAVYFAEIHLEDLQKASRSIDKMKPLPQFPSSLRDLTLTVPDTLSAKSLIEEMRKIDIKFLEEISLIDLYRDEKLGSGVKNMTFRFVYRDLHRTLSVEEVEAEHGKLTNQIRGKL